MAWVRVTSSLPVGAPATTPHSGHAFAVSRSHTNGGAGPARPIRSLLDPQHAIVRQALLHFGGLYLVVYDRRCALSVSELQASFSA
jgi:hypothetical protein